MNLFQMPSSATRFIAISVSWTSAILKNIEYLWNFPFKQSDYLKFLINVTA